MWTRKKKCHFSKQFQKYSQDLRTTCEEISEFFRMCNLSVSWQVGSLYKHKPDRPLFLSWSVDDYFPKIKIFKDAEWFKNVWRHTRISQPEYLVCRSEKENLKEKKKCCWQDIFLFRYEVWTHYQGCVCHGPKDLLHLTVLSEQNTFKTLQKKLLSGTEDPDETTEIITRQNQKVAEK